MKQTILVPTDFSNNSLTAARYAIELAQQMGTDVYILHVYQSFTSAFQTSGANETDEQQAKLRAEDGLAEFMGKLNNVSEIQVASSAVKKSSLLDAVNDYIAENSVQLVIMGAQGESGRRQDLLGNNTYDVAKDVSRPLLIVPEHTKNAFKLEHVVFFSDYQQGDVKSLTSFNSLFGHMRPSCTLVHIHESEDEPAESDRQRLEEWKAVLENETPLDNLSTELAHVPENVDAVNDILKQLNADMTLVTLVDARSFFKKLLHKSLARTIVLNPQTPVLLTSEDTE
ncbi:universal stress protein [Sphingobacterium gobiense]|uniref:UspA domain-containing protein n=1 Tax=Sphingobacterium gobiense TaxID=1382456 RepID=A0A2S9JEQ3_9SPHI|nr:universal stress protein [Sphingobacterium gobiense]PRD51393.1 hypothetical protein C5749_18475 [Sphingobacterium gobiense]